MKEIFKPVQATQKVEKGVDPKSVLCSFFKQGLCTRGDKCKFSHDLTVERKREKLNIYCDQRDSNDTMENWDENKLKEVVEKKHGEKEKGLPKTDIICKNFLEALENSKYGWFWECPNGGDKCHYRHALPAGFVLKRDKKKEKKDEISIEELVENERAKVSLNTTKLTLESFMAWKKRKIEEKRNKNQKEMERKAAEFKAGKNIGLSGREMFTFNPDLVIDNLDDDEAAFDCPREDDDDDEETPVAVKEINFDSLQNEARESDGTGTIATDRVFEVTEVEPEPASASGGAEASVVVDENLFEEDIDDDLDNLEEEINSLSVK